MPFKKAEIILAYTAHSGSGVSKRGRERGGDERGEIRFGVATVSVSVCGCSNVATH